VRHEVATFIEEFIGVRDEVQVQTLSELSWSEEDATANAREIRGKGRCQFATAITAPARQGYWIRSHCDLQGMEAGKSTSSCFA
jgi:hypothetical protein